MGTTTSADADAPDVFRQPCFSFFRRALAFASPFGGGLPVPFARLCVVLRYAVTVGVKPAETARGVRVVLGGSLLVPVAGLAVILRYSLTRCLKHAETSS
jgi:hypothetical protein